MLLRIQVENRRVAARISTQSLDFIRPSRDHRVFIAEKVRAVETRPSFHWKKKLYNRKQILSRKEKPFREAGLSF